MSDIHRAPVTHLMFAHNENSQLISASLDGNISVYKLDENPPCVSHTLTGHAQVLFKNNFHFFKLLIFVQFEGRDGFRYLYE